MREGCRPFQQENNKNLPEKESPLLDEGQSLVYRDLHVPIESSADQEDTEKEPVSDLDEIVGEAIKAMDPINFLVEKNVELNNELALKLIEIGVSDALSYHLGKFEDLGELVVMKLIKQGFAFSVMEHLNSFENLDQSKVALEMIEQGEKGAGAVAVHIKNFEVLNHDVALGLIKAGHVFIVAANLKVFEVLNKDVALGLIEGKQGETVIKNLNRFEDFNLDEDIAFKLIELRQGKVFLKYFEKFEVLNQKKIFFKLLEFKAVSYIIRYLNKFEVLDTEMGLALSKFGDIKNIDFSYFPSDIFSSLLEYWTELGDQRKLTDLYLYLAKKKDWQNLLGKNEITDFLKSLPKDKSRDEKRNAFTHNKYDRTSEFLEYLNNKDLFSINNEELVIVGKYVKEYGLAKQDKLYEYFKNIYLLKNGEIEELPDEQGKEGIDDFDILEKKYKELKKLAFSEKELLAEDLNNLGDFEIELLDQITGRSSHAFPAGGSRSMEDIVNKFKYYSSGGEYGSIVGEEDNYYYDEDEDEDNVLNNEYVFKPEQYKSIDIQSSSVSYEFDKKKLEKEDSYYNILKTEVLAMFDLGTNDEVKIEALVSTVKEKVEFKINNLEETYNREGLKEEARNGIGNKIQKYKNLLVDLENIDQSNMSYDDILKPLLVMGQKEFHKLDLSSVVRQIIFRKVLEKEAFSQQNIEKLKGFLLEAEASGQSLLLLSKLINNLIKNHVLNFQEKKKGEEKNNSKKEEKEDWEYYWTPEMREMILKTKQADGLIKAFNPYSKELKKEVKSLKAVEIGEGNISIGCYPDRGIIGEMSGFLGEACYTAVHSLLAKYPNVIPYKFIDNTDPENKEFLGSVLLFELESEKGEKVVLLRAFNISDESKVNISKFIKEFIEGLVPGLKARGIKQIIVPGEDGTISNGAMVTHHMRQNYVEDKDAISLSETFDFNIKGNGANYDITHNCFVAREL